MMYSVALISIALAFSNLGALGRPLVDSPADLVRRQEGSQFVTGQCSQDFDSQQGCCAFTTAIAQANGDGGCGLIENVASAFGLEAQYIGVGAVNGDLGDPDIQAAAQFLSQLDNTLFKPQRR